MFTLAAEVTAVVNEKNRTGGFAPAQWVLGKILRYEAAEQGHDETAGQHGSLEERADPTTLFGERMAIRHEAKKGYFYADFSPKIAKVMLRKSAPKSGDYRVGDLSAPKSGDYRVGDLVSFQMEQKGKLTKDRRQQWSPATRVIGFEGSQRKVGWVVCQETPCCIATDRWRSRNDSEALAYRYVHH